MLKVAIIGANGFLGSNLLKSVEQNPEEVIFYPVINSNRNNIPIDVKVFSLEEFFKMPGDDLDCIIFAPGSFRDAKSKLIEINFGLLLKIKHFFSTTRLVYISSTNIYGNSASEIRLEDKIDVISDYARGKLSGEFLASSFNSFAILRFTYLYGPGLDNGSFIPYIINTAVSNKKVVLFNKGNRIQDYLYIDDAVALCFKAIKSKMNTTVLGVSGEKVTNKKVAEIIIKNTESCTLEFVEKEEDVVNFSFIVDKNPFEWKAETSFEKGMLKTLKYKR